ncbi:glycoprotein-N-acetylgalactosamine 3-beta-galactosyltransferase 1 [Patella vulgata]|uniref:glycoprotein-N-acetylgalactosamine 3-beta-galactosyltransferase 1 n=1 Tax=Patella vulgata TaxID=6465 RepID=UPI00217FA1A5|nr:glycoprotein-N-acetylgalactosamine 3-beta-galactosyltransferase 1 [Patella vulgata]
MSKKKWPLLLLFSFIVWLLYKLSDVKTGHQNENPEVNSRYFETDEKFVNLKDKVKILCWIMTIPENLPTRATSVKETWAPHCNKYMFVSGVGNKTFPVVELNIIEGRYHLTNKTYTSLLYLYRHHGREYDWFLKADDDTYIIVENLRYMLNSFDPKSPLFIGRKFKTVVPNGYMSGGAGYVLSRRALELIVTKGVHNKTLCPIWSMEDVDIGRCATNVGVSHVDSSADVYGKQRFHPIYLSEYFKPHFDTFMFIYSLAKVKSGTECCSNLTISMHSVKPEQMYMIHFLLYHMEVHGEVSKWPKQFPVS